jgi:hypothetical protein
VLDACLDPEPADRPPVAELVAACRSATTR